jgi:hypothetical protein
MVLNRLLGALLCIGMQVCHVGTCMILMIELHIHAQEASLQVLTALQNSRSGPAWLTWWCIRQKTWWCIRHLLALVGMGVLTTHHVSCMRNTPVVGYSLAGLQTSTGTWSCLQEYMHCVVTLCVVLCWRALRTQI